MSYSKTPRMRKVSRKKAKELATEMRETRKHIRTMIALGASRREISIAVGIPEDSPLFLQP